MKTNSHRPWTAQTRAESPLGPLTLAATDLGLAGLWFDDQAHHPGWLTAPSVPDHPVLHQALHELEAYWSDARSGCFSVPLDLGGTEFQSSVWRLLLEIPAGGHRSYGELALALGRPAASRAVGAAVGRNPVGIIVPCHRVLGRDGALTGYAGGLDRKRDLLRREGLI